MLTIAVPEWLTKEFNYTQGQYLTLRANIDGEEQRRSYSICSAVQDKELKVAIKRVSGGKFSNWANNLLKPGMTIDVMPPTGNFNVPVAADQSHHYLGFAAGSGITPLLSIAKTTLLTEKNSQFTLVYSNRTLADMMFREELAELKDAFISRFNVIYLFSREPQEIELFNGRLTTEKCEQLFQYWLPVSEINYAFICGPAPMIEAVSNALNSHGITKEKIKQEYFASPSTSTVSAVATASDSPEAHYSLSLIIDGATRTLSPPKDGQTILDAALNAGIDVRYACKGGVCATCRCRVVKGEVEMTDNYALDEEDISEGLVLSCRSVPISDQIILNFDQIN